VPVETTDTQLRETLASVLDRVVDDREIVIVRRRGAQDVALLPAAELASLLETAHLMRPPKNAQRLLRSLRRAEKLMGTPQSIGSLRKELGLGSAR
jgi:antitoxin YefM